MFKIMSYENDFYKVTKLAPKPLIIYGAGSAGEKAIPYLEKIDYFCDKNAREIQENHGIKVLLPEEVKNVIDECYILVCVNKREKTFQAICDYLNDLDINAKVFNFYHNIAFHVFAEDDRYHFNKIDRPLRVRLVSYDRRGWILTKFAKKLEENLERLGVDVDIDSCCDPKADINHHIAHHPYEPIRDLNDTLMITHIDSMSLLNQTKFQLETAKMGICMSKETMNMLTMNGVSREKLCYINPAQDGVIKPKKYILGITHRNHADIDHRKKVENVLEICKKINPIYFSFLIMGDGWDPIIKDMKEMGFEVEYYDHFDYEIYTKYVMSKMDYYLFFGYDEGSMGFMDALAAGVKTIVTPQGFHLDIKDGITYPCKTIPDFIDTLLDIQGEREKIVKSIESYTWENYAKKHLEVWEYITRNKSLDELFANKHMYNDGIFSVMMDSITD